MVRCLVFDLDGTLADTSEDLAAAMNFVLVSLGRTAKPKATLVSYIGDGLELFLSRALGTEEPSVIAEGKRLFRMHYAEHLVDATRPYPGVPETLERLTASGRRCFVLSNKPDEFVPVILERLGLARFFEAAYGQYRFSRPKPDPEGLRFILASGGFAPGECLMVGDHRADLEAGRAAGVRTVFCAYGLGNAGGLRPDFVVEAFPDLLRIVEGE